MSDETELAAISNMLNHSKEHGLQVEVVWSLVWEIAGIAVNNNQVDGEDIEKACNHALCEWDI